VARHVRGSGILAYPTETVYGFGGVCSPEAVDRVRFLKRRAEDKPLLVLVESAEAVADLTWPLEARELAGRLTGSDAPVPSPAAAPEVRR